MKMRSLVTDALSLNWALPEEAVGPAPHPLSYQAFPWQGRNWIFASALLFHNRGVHFESAPFLRLSYPQLDLRLHALDPDGVPSVHSLGTLLPRWVRPAVALAVRRTVTGAHFDFPSPSLDPAGESWRWSVEQGGRLEVVARRAGGLPGAGPCLGSWEETVRFFRDRPRAYAKVGGRLQRIVSEQPRVTVWPLAAEVVDDSLLAESMPLAATAWPALHSSWLCPEVSAVFDLRLVPDVPLEAAMPTPAASVRSCARSMRRPTRWPTGRAAL